MTWENLYLFLVTCCMTWENLYLFLVTCCMTWENLCLFLVMCCIFYIAKIVDNVALQYIMWFGIYQSNFKNDIKLIMLIDINPLSKLYLIYLFVAEYWFFFFFCLLACESYIFLLLLLKPISSYNQTSCIIHYRQPFKKKDIVAFLFYKDV
jgi:hypothetical protein